MKNIKLYASPHPAESATACPEVWDAEGDSRDLVGRRSSNLRQFAALPPAVGQGHPAAPPAVSRPAPPPPPPQPTTHHICPKTCN
jgi:hypothetical protein